MRVRVDPPELQIGAGGPAVFTVEVYNTDAVIRAYEVQILGVDPDWCRVTGDGLSLFPGTTGHAVVVVDIPKESPAGRQELAVQIVETTGSDRTETVELVVERAAVTSMELGLHPPLVTGGRSATVTMVIENTGNTRLDLTPTATDLEDKVTASFEPARIEIEPRAQQIVEVRLDGPRPLLGMPEPRTVVMGLEGPDGSNEATATFIQQPWIGRGLVAFAGLLVAATVFTFVLANGIDRIVEEATVSDELLIQAMESDEAAAALAAVPATLSGHVTEALSGEDAVGVTVQVFDAGDDTTPVGTAATGTDGTYELVGVRGGTYKVRFVGDGFANTWLGPASTFQEAEEVAVEPGAEIVGLDVDIGGRPGSAAGVVLVSDPVGAIATLVIPGVTIGSDVDAVVESLDVAADGSFAFENVPSPADYRLDVSKPGYGTQSRAIALGPAEELTGIEVTLDAGDGTISGLVTGVDGALGGMVVTATDGTNVIETATLTTGEIGSFTLRGLLTPGAYTITASGAGYAEQVRTVNLEQGQQVTDLAFALAEDTGTVGGTAVLAGVGPIGGVTVTVTDGELSLSTNTLSSGQVGTWSISGVPSPGTYTVTFGRDDLVPQVRSVHLDPLEGDSVFGVDATLGPVGAVLRGTVNGPEGPAAGVDIQVADGETILSTRTADEPPGRYELSDLAPGTYTVTVGDGQQQETLLVTLDPGETRVIDLTLP